MIASIRSHFYEKDPHEQIFEVLEEIITPTRGIKSVIHIIISCGGVIDEEEINAKIQRLLIKYEWNLPKLNDDGYWKSFARHVTRISFEPYYNAEPADRERTWEKTMLDRFHQVVEHIQTQKSTDKNPYFLQRFHVVKNEKIDPMYLTDSSVFRENARAARRQRYFCYDQLQADRYRCTGNADIEKRTIDTFNKFCPQNKSAIKELQISHPITLKIFSEVVCTLSGLESLLLHSVIPQFGQRGLSEDNLRKELSRLPRSIKKLNVPLVADDQNIVWKTQHFPNLEEMDCSLPSYLGGPPITRAGLEAVSTLKYLTSLTLTCSDTCALSDLALLKQCSMLRKLTLRNAPSLHYLLYCFSHDSMEELMMWSKSPITSDSEISSLIQLKSLKKLRIEIKSLYLIGQLVKAAPQLEEFYLKLSEPISAFYVMDFYNLQNLKKLDLLFGFSPKEPTEEDESRVKGAFSELASAHPRKPTIRYRGEVLLPKESSDQSCSIS